MNTPEHTETVESERMCSVVWTTQECQSEWREETIRGGSIQRAVVGG